MTKLNMKLCYLIFSIYLTSSAHGSHQEEAVIQEVILSNYKTNVRPSVNRQNVTVYFDLVLQNLIDFDVRKQVLTVVTMVMFKWIDPRLRWSANGWLDEVNVASSMIWTPDIVLYNTAESQSLSHSDLYKTNPMISHKGEVTWIAPVTWSISCSSDITWFPFDKQTCIMNFGSWSYPSSKLMIKFYYEDVTDNDHLLKVENGEWEVVQYHACEKLIKFSCCEDHFSAVGFVLVLDRLSLYYFIYILVPLVLLSMLFLMVFFIPYNSGERTGFGVTVLLSITVYLLVISEELPEKSNQTPVLGLCFTELFFILNFSLGMSVFTMNAPKFERKPSRILMFVKNWLEKKNKLQNKRIIEPMKMQCNARITMKRKYSESACQKVLEEEENGGKYEDDWIKISQYLDRFFFVMFVMLIIILSLITVAVIPQSGRVRSAQNINCKTGV